MRLNYILYKEKYAGVYYWRARFLWDEVRGQYLISRNLGIIAEGKRERRHEAEDAAKRIAEELQKEIAPSNKQKNITNTYFLDYLASFWSPGSDYIEEQAKVNKTPLSAMYIKNNQRQIRLHLSPCPLFSNLPLSGLSRKIIRDYKLWAANTGMSGRLINQCLQAMRVAVRYAVANGELLADPFYGAGKAHHKEKQKGILTFEEQERLKNAPVTDYYARLAILLGCLCGMRRGEIRGLQWGDIGDGIITVQHNYVDYDGLKNPKRKGGLVQENTRTVYMPKLIAEVLNVIFKITPCKEPDDFVIQSAKCKSLPVSAKYFAHALDRELSSIGIPGRWPHYKKNEKPSDYVNEQKRRNLTFHSLRHTFVTLGLLAGIGSVPMQLMAGHGPKMQKKYTHADQVFDVREVGKILEKPLLPSAPGPAKVEDSVEGEYLKHI